MYSVKPPAIFRLFSDQYLVCEMPATEKLIYLTFDDGPVPEVTPEVLDILEKRNAKATFFCVGENVKRHPEVFARVTAAGHSIGNHTYNHLNGWITSPGAYSINVERCTELFQTQLFRPPYGRFTPGQYFLLRKKYRFILWSLLSGDFHRNTSPDQCLQNVLKNATSGSIVVFHDSIKAKEKVLFALPRAMDELLAEGYSFRSL